MYDNMLHRSVYRDCPPERNSTVMIILMRKPVKNNVADDPKITSLSSLKVKEVGLRYNALYLICDLVLLPTEIDDYLPQRVGRVLLAA